MESIKNMNNKVKAGVNELSNKIIGAAIEVHRNLGPGLLENIYEECFCCELLLQGFSFERQKTLPVFYKGQQVDCDYCLDIVVEKKVIVEIKSVSVLLPVHEAQLLTYLKISELWLGLLMNFNSPVMKEGIKRIVNGFI
jgi:GxxExxY protein